MSQGTIKVAVRPPATKKIIIDSINEWGPDLKIVMRNQLKRHLLYFAPIELIGASNSEALKSINTLGRWLFGTPKFKGVATFEGFTREQIIIRVPDMPQAEELLLAFQPEKVKVQE